MAETIQNAYADFNKHAPTIQKSLLNTASYQALESAGLMLLLQVKLEDPSQGFKVLVNTVIVTVGNRNFQHVKYPSLLKAIVDRALMELETAKTVTEEIKSLTRALEGDYTETEDQENVWRTALANARLHLLIQNIMKIDIKQDHFTFLINQSNNRNCAPQMIADDCHKFIYDIMVKAPKDVWAKYQHNHPGAKAFDVATNLSKWPSIRSQLISTGYVEFLASLVDYDNYFGFESTEGLAYIVGRSEDAKNSKLLQAKANNVNLLFQVLEGSLNGNPSRFNITWSVYGRLLAIQNLSVADANKKLLRPAIPLLMRVVVEQVGKTENISLALQTLLELTFDEDNKKDLMAYPDVLTRLKEKTKDQDSTIRTYAEGLVFALTTKPTTERRMSLKAKQEGHVMISYNWKHQPLVKDLNEMLKESGVQTWIDIEQMDGDTVEKMAEAVEKASCVLICMSENYKESSNCRLEANYALKMKIPIVPLLVQEGYKPNGWLGFLIGNNLYYDIGKDLEANFQGILKETKKYGGLSSSSNSTTTTAAAAGRPPATSVSSPKKQQQPATAFANATTAMTSFFPPAQICNMTSADVEAWLLRKGQDKTASILKKQEVNGMSCAMIFDLYNRSDGRGGMEVMQMLVKDYGLKSGTQVVEFLYLLRELVVVTTTSSAQENPT